MVPWASSVSSGEVREMSVRTMALSSKRRESAGGNRRESVERLVGYTWFLHEFDEILVGGWATPLKNMKVNWDDEIPNIWENKEWQPNHQPGL